ncbi:hypothetical protein A5678_10565 [Mycobacterium sp. E2733]|nr:hypothetical protein A5678_10565 [Mycobacterium sp. E2733]
MLVSVAIVVGSGLVAAAPAGADPSPFSTLSCSCPETAPAGSPARSDEITQGIRAGELGGPAPQGSVPPRS